MADRLTETARALARRRVDETKHDIKVGDHISYKGTLGDHGLGPVVRHHGEVHKVEHGRFGAVYHLKVHHINGKPAHEYLDHDKVYGKKDHATRERGVLHQAIHHSHFDDPDAEFKKH